jgi:hypothetical protein
MPKLKSIFDYLPTPKWRKTEKTKKNKEPFLLLSIKNSSFGVRGITFNSVLTAQYKYNLYFCTTIIFKFK